MDKEKIDLKLELAEETKPEPVEEKKQESLETEEPKHRPETKEKRKPGTFISFFNMILNPKNGEVHFSYMGTLVLFILITINFLLYFNQSFTINHMAVFTLIDSLPSLYGKSSEMIQMFASLMADSFLHSGKFSILNWISFTLGFVVLCDLILIVVFSIRHIKNPFGKDAWSFGVARMFVPSLVFLCSYILSAFFGMYVLAAFCAILGCFMLGYNIACALDVRFYYLELPINFAMICAVLVCVFYISGKTVNFNLKEAIEDVIQTVQYIMKMYGAI